MSRSAVAKEYGFAAILGLTDGILTALTLAAGSIIGSRTGLSIFLGLRVASASALAGGVVFITAELARRNHELVHAEQQLNLMSHGRLATTRLGHFVVVESSKATIVVVVSNFLGALLPFFCQVNQQIHLRSDLFRPDYAWRIGRRDREDHIKE